MLAVAVVVIVIVVIAVVESKLNNSSNSNSSNSSNNSSSNSSNSNSSRGHSESRLSCWHSKKTVFTIECVTNNPFLRWFTVRCNGAKTVVRVMVS